MSELMGMGLEEQVWMAEVVKRAAAMGMINRETGYNEWRCERNENGHA